MNFTKLLKQEPLVKCEERAITKSKSKTIPLQKKKSKFIIEDDDDDESNKNIIPEFKKDETDEILNMFTKCDVFTTDDISKIMGSKIYKKGSLLEPSVGTGNLLKFIPLKDYEIIDLYELKNIYLEQINYKDININKYNEDFIKSNINKKYDNIIMNPPYIKIQDLSKDYRDYLKENFTILNSGLVDIYYAFIIKCLSLLNNDGIMVSITPNSYLYNKSSLNLRKYLFDNYLIKEIIDYKDKKVFENVSVYCCITIFTKEPKTYLTYNNVNILYSDIITNYSLFNFNSSTNTLKSICKITNGIATLRDGLFIHDEKLFDEPCWKLITNGGNNKYIIYPYQDGKIIGENIFKQHNPLTHSYLEKNKDELKKRDNGNKIYPEWYAFGRSQSITYSTKLCIYIPCFINPPNIDNCLFIKKGMLHHSCLCIEPYNESDINTIIETIKKNIKFITDNSSKRSAGWINISSRILYEVELTN
jgi:hypothetical protein